MLENLFRKYLNNFHVTYVNQVTNKNLDDIIYNSIHFGYWNHQCTSIPKEDRFREFVLLTINFSRGNNENSRPGETPEEKATGFGFQIFVSLNQEIFFRIFDWGTQKYLNWKEFSFLIK